MIDNMNDFYNWEKASRDTIDFKKIYCDIAGDVRAGLVLSELVYWYLPGKDGNSRLRVKRDDKYWIAVRRYEWWERTRMSPRQADYDIKKLIGIGVIEKRTWKFAGEPTVHIRIIESKFLELFNHYVKNPLQNPFLPDCKNHVINQNVKTKLQKCENLNTETTSEITTKTTIGSNKVATDVSFERITRICHEINVVLDRLSKDNMEVCTVWEEVRERKLVLSILQEYGCVDIIDNEWVITDIGLWMIKHIEEVSPIAGSLDAVLGIAWCKGCGGGEYYCKECLAKIADVIGILDDSISNQTDIISRIGKLDNDTDNKVATDGQPLMVEDETPNNVHPCKQFRCQNIGANGSVKNHRKCEIGCDFNYTDADIKITNCEECGIPFVDNNYEIDFDNQQLVCPECYREMTKSNALDKTANDNTVLEVPAERPHWYTCECGKFVKAQYTGACQCVKDAISELQLQDEILQPAPQDEGDWTRKLITDKYPDERIRRNGGLCPHCGSMMYLIGRGMGYVCSKNCQEQRPVNEQSITDGKTLEWKINHNNINRDICGMCGNPDGVYHEKSGIININICEYCYVLLDDLEFCGRGIEYIPVMGKLYRDIYFVPNIIPTKPLKLQSQHYRVLAIAYVSGQVRVTSRSFISEPNLPAINQLVEDGLLRKRYSHFVLTDNGKEMCDNATSELLEAIKKQRDAVALRENGKSKPKQKSAKVSKQKYPDEIQPEIREHAEKMCELLYKKSYKETTQDTRGMVVPACWSFKRAGYGIEAIQTVYDYHISNGWKGFTPQSLVKHLDAALAAQDNINNEFGRVV